MTDNQPPATKWSDHEDEIADAISDSIDMDWNSRDGARAVVRWLEQNAPIAAPAALNEAVGLLRRMFDVEFHGTVPTWSVERIRSVYGINRRSDLIVEIVAFLANLEGGK